MADLNSKINRVVWVDIPVADLHRAMAFYAAVLAVEVAERQPGDTAFGVLGYEDGNGVSLVVKPEEVAADRGSLVYLNTHGRLRHALSQVAAHGGKVLQEVHSISPHGFRAVVLDSEGNRVALHSNTDA